jgi:hypothetical protein
MSTMAGLTNEGPLPHSKKLETPQLGSVIDTGRGRREFALSATRPAERAGI